MRLLVVLLVLMFVAFGALFGALNSDTIALDFYFTTIDLPKGAAVLAALLLGWLLGGLLVWLTRVPRLRRELRRARQANPPPAAPVAATTVASARNE